MTAATIRPTSRPRLARYLRLNHDPARETDVLVGPEGVIALNATGAAIVALCDGDRNVSAISAELGRRYNRDVDADVAIFLSRLAERRLLEIDDAG